MGRCWRMITLILIIVLIRNERREDCADAGDSWTFVKREGNELLCRDSSGAIHNIERDGLLNDL